MSKKNTRTYKKRRPYLINKDIVLSVLKILFKHSFQHRKQLLYFHIYQFLSISLSDVICHILPYKKSLFICQQFILKMRIRISLEFCTLWFMHHIYSFMTVIRNDKAIIQVKWIKFGIISLKI